MQRITDNWPPGLYSHHTGGEHALRVSGDERYIEQLRAEHGLEPLGVSVYEYAHKHDGYVMAREVVGSGVKPELAGYLLASSTVDHLGKRYHIDDMLVRDSLRHRGIGSFLLGHLAKRGRISRNQASLLYADAVYIDQPADAEAAKWLISRGFAPNDDITLELKLPGITHMNVPRNYAQEMITKMPIGLNCCIEFVDEQDETPTELTAFRQGIYVGSVTPLDESRYVDNGESDVFVRKYHISIPGVTEYDAEFTDDFFAVVDLLNQKTA